MESKRKYINNMGIKKISKFSLITIDRFKKYHPKATKGLSSRDILMQFENDVSFLFTRFSTAATIVSNSFNRGSQDDSK